MHLLDFRPIGKLAHPKQLLFTPASVNDVTVFNEVWSDIVNRTFWKHEGHSALRMGKWKLVSVNPKGRGEWELYDMEKDRTEMNNHSNVYPEKRNQMIEKWTKIAYETNTLPWPDNKNAQQIPIDK